jgi:hypothetical protein
LRKKGNGRVEKMLWRENGFAELDGNRLHEIRQKPAVESGTMGGFVSEREVFQTKGPGRGLTA